MASASERLLIARFAAQTRELTRGIAQVNKSISGISTTTEKTNSKIGSTIGGMGRAIGKTVASGAAIATGAVVALGTAAIKSGISYNILQQRSRAAFKTILGSAKAADKMMSDLAKFSKTSPFPRQVFIQATQQMLAFGIASKDVIPILGAVQDAVAAAGGSAADLQGVVSILSKISSSGKITGEDLNQLGNFGINAADLIGKAMGKSGKAIREEISKGSIGADQAIAALTKGMKDKFGGAAENLKTTWVGAFDRIKGALRDIGSRLVAPFIDPKGGGYAVEWANKVADLMRALEKQIGPIMDGLGKKFKPILDKVGPTIDKITKMIDGMGKNKAINGLIDGFKTLMPIIAPIAGIFAGLGSSQILGAFGPLAKILPIIEGPLGAVLGGLIGLVATSPDILSAFKPIIKLVGDMAKQFGPIFGSVLKALMPILSKLIKLLSGQLYKIMIALMPIIMDVAKQLIKSLMPAFLSIVDAVLPLIPVFADLLVTLAPLIKTAADLIAAWAPVLVVIAQLAGVIIKEFVPAIRTIIPAIAVAVKFFSGYLLFIAKIVTTVVKAVVKAFQWLFNKLVGRSIVPDLIKSIVKWFTSLIGWVMAPVRKLVNWIVSTFTWLRSRASALISSMVDTLKRLASNLYTSLSARFRQIRDTIVRIVTGLASWLSSKWGGIRDRIGSLAAQAKDRALNAFRSIRDAAYSIFNQAVSNISKAWGKLKNVLKSPVSFLINTIINGGIIRAFNWIAGKVGAPKIGNLSVPGFDQGGWTGPGRRNKVAGLVHGDEFVVKKPSRRKIEQRWPGLLDYINRWGTLPGYQSGGKVSLRGKTFTSRFAGAIQNAQKLAKTIFNLFQGGFRPATSYSGTSHRGDAVDLGPVNARNVRALRASGIAAWDRTGMGNWVPHIHGVPLPGFGSPGGSAVWQAHNYLSGGNGLGGRDNGAGSGYRPWPITGAMADFVDIPSWLGKFKDVVSMFKNKIAGTMTQMTKADNYWESVVYATPKSLIDNAGETLKAGFKEKFSFDRGGWLPTGTSLVHNGTGRPEAVFTQDQMANQGAITINVQGAIDPDSVARQIKRLLDDHDRRRGGVLIGARTR